MLARLRPDTCGGAHASPADIVRVVEVAESSLRPDRAVKLPIYAHQGIVEVWVVDLLGATAATAPPGTSKPVDHAGAGPHAASVPAAEFLAIYDAQLRTDAETLSALTVTRLGPLRLVTFPGGRGFITYPNPGTEKIAALVPEAIAHYRSDPTITRVEWKTRGHDHAPGLHESLAEYGFVRGAEESIMIGEARLLATDGVVPPGVTVRTVSEESEIRRMSAMTDEVLGDPVSREGADALLDRLARGDGTELWVAEADGLVVSAGRLEPVAETNFAGIWGGATRPGWRGRGLYRAVTAARATSALRRGRTMIHSDSTEFSRPILQRAGLLRVSTTTPYEWRRKRPRGAPAR